MKLIPTLLALVASTFAMPAAAENWEMFNADRDTVYLWDAESSTPSSIWVAHVQIGPTTDNPILYGEWHFRCSLRKAQRGQLFGYDDNGDVATQVKPDTEWLSIPPGSTLLQVYNYVCSGKTPEGTAPSAYTPQALRQQLKDGLKK